MRSESETYNAFGTIKNAMPLPNLWKKGKKLSIALHFEKCMLL